MGDQHPAPEMLPCPFCGDSAQLETFARLSHVLCTNCNARTADFADPAEAIAAWNTRPSANTIAVDGLVELVKLYVDPFSVRPEHEALVNSIQSGIEPPQPVVVPGDVADLRTAEEIMLGCSVMATALERDGMPNAALYMRTAVAKIAALTRPATDTLDTAMVEAKARELCAANFAAKGCEGDFGSVDDCWWAFVDEARASLSTATEKTPQGDRAELIERVKRCLDEKRLRPSQADVAKLLDALTADAALIAELRERVKALESAAQAAFDLIAGSREPGKLPTDAEAQLHLVLTAEGKGS